MLFSEAKRILETVIKKFKSIDEFIEASFGPNVTVEEATEKVVDYINKEEFPTAVNVIWCEELIGR